MNSVEHTNKGVTYYLGGATANGKSTLVKSGLLPHPKGIVTIDSDYIKSKLPEYNLLVKLKDKEAANFVHDESSDITKKLLKTLNKNKNDFVLDSINDGDIDKLLAKIQDHKQNGARIRADYCTLDTKTSLKLANDRGKRTGRYVPESYIKEVNSDVSKLIPQLIEKKAYDELYLWDTSMLGKPRLILKQINGKLKIFDEKLYKDFLLKAL
jgi:predicted ABC-type ATPase